MLRKRLPVFAALALGWIVGGFNASSPTAVAQVARITLDSLQTQVNNIVGGTTTVAKATTATSAVNATNATTAASVPWTGVTGMPASIADGDDVGVSAAGAGLNIAGNTVSLDTASLDTRYTAKSVPTPVAASNAVNKSYVDTALATVAQQGNIQIGAGATATRPASPATGTMFLNTTTNKVEVWNGTSWLLLN